MNMEAMAKLEGAHARQRQAVADLVHSARAMAAGRASTAQFAALLDALDYFVRAVPRHYRDEEESLFPRLRLRLYGTKDAAKHERTMTALGREHVKHNAIQLMLGEIISQWGMPTLATSGKRLLTVAMAFAKAYDSHEAKESVLYDLAGALLSQQDDAAMLEEMELRRGTSRHAAFRPRGSSPALAAVPRASSPALPTPTEPSSAKVAKPARARKAATPATTPRKATAKPAAKSTKVRAKAGRAAKPKAGTGSKRTRTTKPKLAIPSVVAKPTANAPRKPKPATKVARTSSQARR